MLKIFAILTCVVIGSVVLENRSNYKATPTTAPPFSKLLSKFHQNDFKLVFERIELPRFDSKFAKVCVRTYKFNRTTPVVDASGFVFVQPGYNIEIIAQVYRFASNEYREFPMRFQFNFCEAIASSAFGLDQLIKNGNNIICPLLKNKWYNFTKFTPDGEKFPPFIPSGRYMMELQFWYESKELWALYGYGIIERPISIPTA